MKSLQKVVIFTPTARSGIVTPCEYAFLISPIFIFTQAQLKHKIQHTGSRSPSARPPRRLCHRPAVTFLPPLITFSFPQGQIRRVSQALLFQLFKLFLIGHSDTG